jgi:hypothetical protein
MPHRNMAKGIGQYLIFYANARRILNLKDPVVVKAKSAHEVASANWAGTLLRPF